jgi:soluble lytic murein transglycosylase
LIGIFLLLSACSAPLTLPFLATATPSSTPTPVATPTLTPSPTPPPTATPLPAAKLHMGETALFLGDYEQARREYQDALSSAGDDDTRAAAAIGMGHTLALMHNDSSAITQLNNTIQSYPKSKPIAQAWFFLAQSYTIQKMYPEAAQAYAKYLELRPGILDGYVQEWRGDVLLLAGDASAATAAYLEALKSPLPGDPIWVRIKLGKAYVAQKDYKNAITLFLDIYQNSNNDYARAQVNFLMGQTYLALGVPEQAYARFQDSVQSFPSSYDTYSGLVELVNANIPVSDLDRGIVDYYASQYGLADDALSRYITNQKQEDSSAYYFRALSRRAANHLDTAIEDFNTVIEKFPNDRYWSKAFQQKAITQWAYQEKYDDAAATLLHYVDVAKDASDAPDMVYEAARTYERGNNLTLAAQTWEKLIETFPSAEQSYRGLFLSGITYYRLNDMDKALTVFQRVLVLSTNPEDQAAAHLWIGKIYTVQAKPENAKAAWEQAVQRDPTGYYSERASELLNNRQPFSQINPFDLGYDLNAERPGAEAWLRTTFALSPDINLADMNEFFSNPAFVRGEELYNLGLYADARDEFETVRKAVLNDPAQTFRLMNYLLEHNLYRQAILSSRQVLDLAHMDDAATLSAPAYFNHIRFGVYFRDLIQTSSKEESLSPLFLLSVIRQESLFEPFAESSAGARGLMQIVPATGKEIAAQLSWPPDYNDEDLDRPIIAIPMGTRYMARQSELFKGCLTCALAAYNGGPGNTLAWNDLSKGDPDLFLEVIRADETRTYIKQIFEFYNIYRLIYEQRP